MEQADVGEVVRQAILDGRRRLIPITVAMVAVSIALTVVGVQLGLRSVQARSTIGPLPDRQGAAEFDPAGASTVSESPLPTPNPYPDDGLARSVPPSAADEVEAIRKSPHADSADPTSADSAATSRPSPPLPPNGTDGDQPSDPAPAERGRAALDSIAYPWETQLPEWTIDFLDERSGLLGLTLVAERRIEIYVRPEQSHDLLVHIVAHEIGHAVDVSLNDGPDRRRWQGARGIEDEPWWPNDAASDFSTGAGDFAESFAYWQVRSDNYRSELGPAPTPSQLQLMAELAAG